MGPGGFALFAGPGCLKRPRAAAFLLLLLVVPRVFRASEAPAAREARQPHCVRRRASKPARALRTLRRPPHQWGWVADVWLCVSSRSLARPSGPSGALRTSGAWCAGVWLGASPRSLARPCRRPWAPQPGPAFCSSPVPSGPSGALRTSGVGALMCGSAFRLEAWPGPAAAHGHRSQAIRTLRHPPHQWCPVAVVWFGACCYKRRQSELLFVRIFLRLLQTSSIRRHFCEK